MIESKMSLPLCCCDTGLSVLDILTDLAFVYARSPMLIIAAIIGILQQFLMIFHKFNLCGKMLPAGKGGEKCVSRMTY
ncbi:hypothetical protein NDI47_25760 [Microcoleus vaginatus GB1-A2]|uniref:hypothetical protein n=1 Tax=Microcoleus vaginatus TaxID=119532 RepID=UPI001685169D|nr:hypothetical protein [Microcoleus sp. FACHB-61]